MIIKATHLCRCGHQANSHTSGIFYDEIEESTLKKVVNNSKKHALCGRCSLTNGTCREFVLPNLDLIEYLAKEKGLI
jgi:hypothetical protein